MGKLLKFPQEKARPFVREPYDTIINILAKYEITEEDFDAISHAYARIYGQE